MGCLGVHFSLSSDEVQRLRDLRDESARVDHVRETIEEEYFANQPDRLAETDKAWDAMHRALADGELTWDGGDYPLNHVILGGELLYTEPDFIMVLKTPEQVRDVAAALRGMTEEEFRLRYFAINAEGYEQGLSEEDFGYTWDHFQGVRDFWTNAASEGRYVLFTANQ
jgi:hypothetical protein